MPLLKYFIEQHKCTFDLLVWVKTNCTPFSNNTYLPNLEYCLMFREKGITSLNHSKEYGTKKKYWLSGTNVQDKANFEHPTIKPIEFVENHIKNSTNENDVVLDPFLGSGTTALACKHLKRKYIGFEIEEKYYKIATDRLQGVNAKGEMNLFDLDFNE